MQQAQPQMLMPEAQWRPGARRQAAQTTCAGMAGRTCLGSRPGRMFYSFAGLCAFSGQCFPSGKTGKQGRGQQSRRKATSAHRSARLCKTNPNNSF